MMIKEIKFTNNALKHISEMLSKKNKGSFFRIAIKGGGCSGFQYNFSFDNKQEDDDLRHENIIIDKKSADLLKGSEVDYVEELIGENFKISNPQSKSSCGCGVSFSL
jgi:iron-sulfur cluster insertion protein